MELLIFWTTILAGELLILGILVIKNRASDWIRSKKPKTERPLAGAKVTLSLDKPNCK